MRLRVTPDILIREAAYIRKQIQVLTYQFYEIGDEVRRSRSYWEGTQSEIHNQFYEELKEEMGEVLKRLKSHPSNLLKMAGLYQETEAEVVEEIQFLTEDVIV